MNASPDPQKAAADLVEMTLAGYRLLSRFMSHGAERAARPQDFDPGRLDPLAMGRTFLRFIEAAGSNPERLIDAQARMWKTHFDIWSRAVGAFMGAPKPEPVMTPAADDRRFRDAQWDENPVFDLIRQSYLATAREVEDFVRGVEGLDEHDHAKAVFHSRRFMEAAAPTNFLFSNPQAIRATLDSGGRNLVDGVKNLIRDIDPESGELRIRQIDPKAFKVGGDIAVTAGKVICQNEMMQLIQYEPASKTVFKTPLLIVPPWINKFYILDLTAEKSFVRWATEQGCTVFMISWVNPGPELARKSFEDYMIQGPLAAMDAVEQATGERRLHLIGYCIGGTLTSCLAAHLAAKGDDRLASMTLFAAQTDFREAGELKVFIDEPQLAALSRIIDDNDGLLPAREMAQTFNMLRANDLIWSYVINNYLLGRDPFPLDLLFWNADSTRMPGVMHLFYLRRFYLADDLASGRLSMNGTPLHLDRVKIPLFIQAACEDHIAPCRSVYRGARLFGGAETTFMLAGSGHIAGVVNPPSLGKYQHWRNDALPETFEKWMEGAEEIPGSWWPYWHEWLRGRSGKRVAARRPGDGKLKPIEDAPGSYVTAR